MKDKEIKTGIYRIHDNKTNQDYIGQSIDIDLRIKYHFKYGNLKTHIDRAIHSRPEDFSWSIIELTNIEQLDEREQYWIDYYHSYEKGYNHSIGGKGPINNNSISKKVYQYDYTYSSLINVFYSISDAARFMGVSASAICDVCKGQSYNGNNCYHCNGYGFVYADNVEEKEKRYSLFNNHSFAVIELNNLEIPNYQTISFYNRQTDIAQKYGFNVSSLSSCIHGKRHHIISKNNIKYTVCNIKNLKEKLFELNNEELVQVEYQNHITYYININAFCKEKKYNWQRVKYAIDHNLLLEGYSIKIINKSLLIELEDNKDA